MLGGECCTGLIHLVEAHVLLDGFRLLLDIDLKDLSEVVFEFYNGVVVHRAQMLAQCVDLH